MKCFKWRAESSRVFGTIERPVAEIWVQGKNGEWQDTVVYVDSGADVTILPRSFAHILGIDIESGQYAVFGGIGAGKIETYIHRVKMKIGDYASEADVAFAVTNLVPNLLGRRDLFKTYEIQFKNMTEQTCFIKTRPMK